MGKVIYGIVMALLIGIVMFPGTSSRNNQSNLAEEKIQRPDPNSEITMKQALVDEDVRITEELCREQCLLHARDQLGHLSKESDQGAARSKLASWFNKHREVVYVQYESVPHGSSSTASGESVIRLGEIPAGLVSEASIHLEEARKSIMNGQAYTSPRLQADGNLYFVYGQLTEDRKHSLLGVIDQNILTRVENHQRKNMRLKPFETDKRLNIKTVDSGSMQPKDVRGPEDHEGTSHYERRQVIVKFRKAPTTTQLGQIMSEINGGVVRKIGNTYVFQSKSMEANNLMQYFRKWHVEYVEPNYYYLTNDLRQTGLREGFYGPPYRPVKRDPASGEVTDQNLNQTQDRGAIGIDLRQRVMPFHPNDVLYNRYQWNLRQIGSEQGWQLSRSAGKDVIVAVIDTGVDLTHPDIQDHLVKGYNVINPELPPEDDVGHGTHVAGVISAVVNNRLGIAGMTWTGRIMPVKVLDETGAGSTYAVAQGIIWAVDNGAKVINMSLGNYADSDFLHEAVRYAFDRDVVLVAASGNDNTNQPSYPAYYPEVFAVAASDADKSKAPFSNYGDYIDITAPGVNIPSTYPSHQYAALSGTSMASPHVASLAALIRSVNPSLRNTEVMELIRRTAEDLGDPGTDSYFGYGLINIPNAVQAAK